MVIKTGPDRPVQPIEPGTGSVTDPEDPKNRSVVQPGKEPENRKKTGKTAQNRRFGRFPYLDRFFP
ncbi:hypothetical protein MTR_5g064730 [Medicago truncatula]|uniref:Uncharacterized protein n=1 Tax=Medicago truncatula TaxID=3880 RepID=G7KAH7_MEDTR|nr:hypothetical protein MTR_5g064730 [Medicago truncatula]